MPHKTICLALMVHNEAHLLPRLFENIGERIDSAVILVHPDYEDNSAEVASELCEKYGLKYEVHKWDHPGPFDDNGLSLNASNSRNQVLEMARGYDEDYVLWLDPDDPLIGTIPDELTAPLYSVEVRADGLAWTAEHLIAREATHIHWVGAIHEGLNHEPGEAESIEDCYIDRTASGGGVERMKKWDLPLLLSLVKADPNDGHAWFYLAQTYQQLGKAAEAVAAWNHRAEMGGLPQTVYWARLQVAELTASPDDYLIAWNTRPQRVEALHRLSALYNAKSQFWVGKMFATFGLQLPPTDDGQFVERWVEEYGLLGELAFSEYSLGNIGKAREIWQYVLSLESLRPQHRAAFELNMQESAALVVPSVGDVIPMNRQQRRAAERQSKKPKVSVS